MWNDGEFPEIYAVCEHLRMHQPFIYNRRRSLNVWATPSILIFLFYPSLHMQHIQTAHSPSPWITQMYSSQVLRAGKQDQSASLWPYSLWLFEYMRLKHRAAQLRGNASACLLVFMHAHACIQVCVKVLTDTGTTSLSALGDWQWFYRATVLICIPGTLTQQLEIPLATMFSWGIFNRQFPIFPQQRPISALPWLKCIHKQQRKAIITLLKSVSLKVWVCGMLHLKRPEWRFLVTHTWLSGSVCLPVILGVNAS